MRVAVTLARERGMTANVIGLWPGTDERLKDEVIVIGAHYDHLGQGGEGSLAPEQTGAVHPGADDNASGAAAVLALARAFAARGGAPRTLLFALFSAEEMGLLGSAHLVAHPPVPIERVTLMVNLDMVGRMRESKVYVGGVDSGTGLRDVLKGAAAGLSLTLELRGEPWAPSDHTSFYAAGRPVLFLFTGAHDDYHRPSDTWDKINAAGLRSVVALAQRVVDAVAAMPTPPTYVKWNVPSPERRAGYGAFFGVVPGFGESRDSGVKVTGVRAESPAEKAGVRAGDVIVGFAGVAVRTLEDLTFALRSRQPGDRVKVLVERRGKQEELTAVLEERR